MSVDRNGASPMLGLVVIGMCIAVIFGAIGMIVGAAACDGNGQALIDTIAPTAAQAREQGWVNISERL